MSDRGYAATSISDICRETGLPTSAIYHHFGSKAGVLSAVMERGARLFFEALDGRLRDLLVAGPSRVRLARYLRTTSEIFGSHQEFLRLYLILVLSREAPESAVVVERVRSQGLERMHRMIASSFSDHGAEAARNVADQLSDFGLSGFEGAFLGVQAKAQTSYDQLLDQLAEGLSAIGERLAAEIS